MLFENPHVRVFEGRTSYWPEEPDAQSPANVLVSLDWIRLKLTLPDGKTVIHDFSPNQVQWIGEGRKHSWEAIARQRTRDCDRSEGSSAGGRRLTREAVGALATVFAEP